jgi:hypothetical protein
MDDNPVGEDYLLLAMDEDPAELLLRDVLLHF